MTQRLAFAATAALVAFVIVVLGAVGAYVALAGPAGTAAVAAPQAQTAAPAPPPPGAVPGGGAATDGYPITPDAAAALALSTVPGATLVQQPRLVQVNSMVVYEVALDQGYIYIDANSGQVLYNGANGTVTRPRGPRR